MAVQTRSRSASLALEAPLKKKRLVSRAKVKERATGGKSSEKRKIDDCDVTESLPVKKARKSKVEKEKAVEKRQRRFREHAPKSYTDRLERALSQRFVFSFPRSLSYVLRMLRVTCRMFVIDRASSGTDGVPEQTIELAGTTGNIYSITINKVPNCTCPDSRKGNQCKHIIYVSLTVGKDSSFKSDPAKVLHNVLKAPAQLQYQLAFLSHVSLFVES